MPKTPPVDISIDCDSSLSSWGGVINDAPTGGHWIVDEAKQHVNYLEL